MKLKSLMQPLLIAVSLLLTMFLSLLFVQQVGLAQGGGPITMTKTLNKSSNVVRVGEVLSFTIALTNNSAFTLTSVTVVDEYDTSVLAFARAIPAHDNHTSATGTITWSNVATAPFPLLTIPPGQGITLTVVFTAEHPKPTVVNKARAKDLIHSMGMLSQTGETSKTQEAIGGSAPVFKALQPPNSTPQAGFPITFTHLITNDGAAIMTHLPLTDTYDPAFLQFNTAVPTPTIISPGLLVWTDLTSDFGNISPLWNCSGDHRIYSPDGDCEYGKSRQHGRERAINMTMIWLQGQLMSRLLFCQRQPPSPPPPLHQQLLNQLLTTMMTMMTTTVRSRSPSSQQRPSRRRRPQPP